MSFGIPVRNGVGIGLLASTSLSTRNRTGFNPAAVLFSAGEQGGWYDPSDISTLFQDTAGTTPVTATGQTVGLLLDKSGRGNHLTQATAASRPIYGIEPFGGRRNLLTWTEQFDNAAWTKTRSTLTANDTVAPDGTLTGDKLEANATHPSASGLVLQAVTIAAGATTPLSFYFKAGNATWAMLVVDDNSATNAGRIWFNIVTGVVGTTAATGTGFTASGGAVQSVGNGWYRCSATFTTGTATTIRAYAYAAVDANGSTVSTLGNFAFIWGAQLETSSTATAYQRVTDQWNVTQAGVPSVSYVQYDGTDDWFISPTITPGIDKAQVFAGVRKLRDTTQGAVVELSSSTALNNGAFLLAAPDADATATYGFDSKGTVQVDAVATGFATPVTSVVTGLADISGDSAIIRVNGVQADADTGDQGTGNFLAYPLYVGRRNTSPSMTLPFSGRMYQMIVRFGANLDAATIAATEAFVNSKTGAYV